MRHLINICILASLLLFSCVSSTEDVIVQNTEILDTITQNALKEWQSDHFGMFIHFGVYSELGGIWKGKKIPYYGEQIMNHARIPVVDYEEVARRFNPADFDAEEIVRIAKEAGMKYIVFTTKHHDGFCMFDTKTTDYDIVDFTPLKRDIVKELADACKNQGMKLGFYYSLPDWHFPQGISRLEPDTTTDCTQYVNQVYSPLEIITPELEDYIVAQLTELLTNYGEITTIWFDMGLVKPEQSRRFRETVKSIQPQCLVSGRIMNQQGDYLTLPDNGDVVGYTNLYWDNPASLYNTWGYKSWIKRPNVEQQADTQIQRLLSTVSHGGVFLLNIGPMGSGEVLDYEKQVLKNIGTFLNQHPDTLDNIQVKQNEAPLVLENDNEFILINENGLIHAAFDATGYMTTQADSWRSWNIEVKKKGNYDVFIVYLPENDDKTYSFICGDNKINHTLPGVDRMIQTSFVGTMQLCEGDNTFIFEQAERYKALEPLGLELKKIIIRRR